MQSIRRNGSWISHGGNGLASKGKHSRFGRLYLWRSPLPIPASPGGDLTSRPPPFARIARCHSLAPLQLPLTPLPIQAFSARAGFAACSLRPWHFEKPFPLEASPRALNLKGA
jgi:hypothetical protein